MNPLYEIFNQPYIEQQKQQNHINQIIEVRKSAKALKDFLDSFDKIQPEYQRIATNEYCAVLFDYFDKHNRIK